MNRRALVPSVFRPVALMLGGVAILLAGDVAAEAIPDPPPICDIRLAPPGDHCPAGSHPDVYWPRVCPKQNIDPGPDVDYRLFCREDGAAPRPAIFCTDTSDGVRVCEGEPQSLDGSLRHAWSATGLKVSELNAGDPTAVQVECDTRPGFTVGWLTLTVSSSGGPTATVTGPLSCPD